MQAKRALQHYQEAETGTAIRAAYNAQPGLYAPSVVGVSGVPFRQCRHPRSQQRRGIVPGGGDDPAKPEKCQRPGLGVSVAA
ncbi:hypothetical protein [Vreelandella alkaliphila]|uniref:hypothetical protein n=1 Tax=Vreelandella alkaliphila TaxID=272774 RepID=UPI0011AB83FC|nr:hypothetical protein [Halomonas alkaliphila]